LWTTPDGIARWWSPDGFAVEVTTLELRAGGALVYTMTATGAAQIEFMTEAGLPLSTQSRKTFVEVDKPRRLVYDSLIDFVPGVPPYEHRTVVELAADGDGDRTQVTMTMDRLHDEEWTQRLAAGRANELDNLVELVAGSRG
jgi:uncharacterized protein YndB with AHSA1/START domain